MKPRKWTCEEIEARRARAGEKYTMELKRCACPIFSFGWVSIIKPILFPLVFNVYLPLSTFCTISPPWKSPSAVGTPCFKSHWPKTDAIEWFLLMDLRHTGNDIHVTGVDHFVSLQGLADNQYRVRLRCIKVNNKACLDFLVLCQQSLWWLSFSAMNSYLWMTTRVTKIWLSEAKPQRMAQKSELFPPVFLLCSKMVTCKKLIYCIWCNFISLKGKTCINFLIIIWQEIQGISYLKTELWDDS